MFIFYKGFCYNKFPCTNTFCFLYIRDLPSSFTFMAFNLQHSLKCRIPFLPKVDTPRFTRISIACDAFYMREKQSDTFGEHRCHFISTPMAARLVCSQLRGRLIDGVPFHSSLLCEVVLFLPQFLYFFDGRPTVRAIDLHTQESSFPSFQLWFLSSLPA